VVGIDTLSTKVQWKTDKQKPIPSTPYATIVELNIIQIECKITYIVLERKKKHINIIKIVIELYFYRGVW